jgi:hypothetical protein
MGDAIINKNRILVISIILLILIYSNIGLYFLLAYLEQSDRIHYGYRIESTEYREGEYEMIHYRSDNTGYLKFVRNSSSDLESEEIIIERFDLNRKKLWSCTEFLDWSIPMVFNEHESIVSTSLPPYSSMETEEPYYDDEEVVLINQNSVKREYNYTIDTEVIFTYIHEIDFPPNDLYDFLFISDYHAYFPIIDGDQVIITDIGYFNFQNKTDGTFVFITTNFTLLYFDLENQIVLNSTITFDKFNHSQIGYDFDQILFTSNYEFHLFKASETRYYLIIFDIKDNHQIKYQVDVSFNEIITTHIETKPIPTEGCNNNKHWCYRSFIPYDENIYIVVEEDRTIDSFRFWSITPLFQASWEIESEPDSRELDGPFYYSRNRFIFTETYGEENIFGKLMLFSEGAEGFQTFALHSSDNVNSLRAYDVFRLNDGKIAIAIEGHKYTEFSDLQVLTIGPKDFEGLLFHHPIIPHLVFSSLMLITIVFIYQINKKKQGRKAKASIKLYPKN